jgi:HEAT repeat protein
VLVGNALVERLTPEASTVELIAFIDAAGALAVPQALERVLALSEHADPNVRLHVARALRRHAVPETPPVLLRLLRDPDWRVRAQAARALGALRCNGAITELMRAARDFSWWVRYRSALALAQIGGPGRVALLELTRCDDPMARDMSALVFGLSSAAVIELSEV